MQQSFRGLPAVGPALLLALAALPLLAACDDNDDSGNGEPLVVSVQAEVEPADAPVQVDVSAIEEDVHSFPTRRSSDHRKSVV